MQIESLKVFCDVARYRSFSRAAAANEISQPAVSQIVYQLERHYGIQLINRSTRPLRLTPMGRTFYEGCKNVMEQYLRFEEAIWKVAGAPPETVQVAAIYSVGLGDMSLFIERFRARHANTKVHVNYLHPDRVYKAVLEGTVDFGIISHAAKSRDVTVLPWRDEEMVLTCAPTHPLAKLKSVKAAQLAGLKYIAFAKDLVIRREVDRFLREQAVEVTIVLEFDAIENIKRAIEISEGVALLPEPTLRREVHAGTLVAVPLANRRLVRPLSIIHRRRATLTTAAVSLIRFLREVDDRESPSSTESERSSQTRRQQSQLQGKKTG